MHRVAVSLSVGLAACVIALAGPAFAEAESIEVSTTANPTQDVPITIKASGVASGSDKLFVYVDELGRTCETEPHASYGEYLTGSSGEALPSGSFKKEYAYTPTYVAYNSGHYSICGYLDTEAYGLPSAMAEHAFDVHLPSASLAFEVSPSTAIQGQSVAVTVAGATQVSRKLYVYVRELGGSCAIDPGNESGATALTNGEALSPGGYVERYAYTPTYAALANTSYTLCGYVAPESYGAPDATGEGHFTVISLASIAEAEQEAAEARAAKKAEEERIAKRKYEEEAPAREAAEKEAAIAAARSKPVSRLIVRAVSHPGRTSRYPGYTELLVSTSHYAYVSVNLRRYGHSAEDFDWGGVSTEVAETIAWSCKSPGGTYSYVVTSKSNVGAARTVRGRFDPVSAARCRTLKQQEAEARERSERRAREERERSEREERERLETYEANCRAEGGTPITLIVEGRAERYCRAPQGGLFPVPH